jgi:hypothetical protein
MKKEEGASNTFLLNKSINTRKGHINLAIQNYEKKVDV